MSTPTTNANTIREAIRDKISLMPLDKIHGQPTYQSYRNLRKQLAKMCAAIKTGAWGGRHGHLALVLFNGEYQTKTGDPNADTDPQDAPPLTPVSLTNQDTLLQRTRRTNSHAVKWVEYHNQEGVTEVVVNRIVTEAIDEQYTKELEDEYMGYANETIKSTLAHIKNEWVVITTLKRQHAKDAFD